jgi:acyl-coenzyme A thioesterase PaaI-like protein
MTRPPRASHSPGASAPTDIRERVLRAIAANREPGLHFGGHLLDIEWRRFEGDTACLAFKDGPHVRNASGTVDVGPLTFLADSALGNVARLGMPPGVRVGTLRLQLQFTGAPLTGDVIAETRRLGYGENMGWRQVLTAGTLSAGGSIVCHASAEFAVLDPPPGVVLAPLPWQRAAPAPAPPRLDETDLNRAERELLATCDAALAKASPHASFIESLWSGAPRRVASGATNRVALGQHVANRVGHVQGGLLLAMAAATARMAAPSAMLLSSIGGFYISPGRGKALKVRSTLLHAGRRTAVIATGITTLSGERVLHAVSQHVARQERTQD